MSFFSHNEYIQEGDLVLAWMNRSNIRPLTVTRGETLHTQYGSFPHDTLIGVKYGTQVGSTAGASGGHDAQRGPSSRGHGSAAGFIHVLAPTPELWSLSLRHRTQIVYTPDASYIVHRLRVRPGSRVLEAGTGSGSFTHALSRTVSSSGQLFTYEFHGPRYEEALQEVAADGINLNTVITHRDVCAEGFDNPTIANSQRPDHVISQLRALNKVGVETPVEGLNLQANAVFLDLPSPWLAIPHLSRVLDTSKQAHICCFSPCIEQVARAVETLKKYGWKKIEMVEVSAKRWEGHKEMVKSVGDAVERLRDIKRRRVLGLRKRNERIARERVQDQQNGTSEETFVASTAGDSAAGGESTPAADDEEEGGNDQQQQSTELKHKKGPTEKYRGFNPWGKGQRIREGDERFSWLDVSRVEPEIKSHTSYLTFAILPPVMPEHLFNADGIVISSLPVSTESASEPATVATPTVDNVKVETTST
ncbi:uncharacterized protein SAPINGB_P000990 [Magnusiomyces paraingens]|uniref:tRNA (adenine(58)-N(1))-methyltransferase catalytic subunit TRM61 n=1 Tax=Magnusiomyces paraingens TaxID=2606893 RepID=A0A5E8B3E2_9ASCO|nr:uncharacterized protein SAPINGB_P000990 [Saprochaete ingens]VVT45987.1 unnamed protein product [Saprochaete ingens]